MISLGLEFEPTSQKNEENYEKSLKMSPEVHSKVISDAIAKHSGMIVEPNQEGESKFSHKKKYQSPEFQIRFKKKRAREMSSSDKKLSTFECLFFWKNQCL